MRRNPLPLLLTVIGLVLAAGLLFSGCGQNRAQATTADADLASGYEETRSAADALGTVDGDGDDEASPADLAGIDDRIERRSRELESRLAAVQRRERAVAEEQAALAAAVETPPLASQPRVVVVELPASTELELVFDETISSETSLVGDPVLATLTRDVLADGRLAIPTGSRVNGSIVDVVAHRRIGGQARLAVGFDTIELLDGERLSIVAFLDVAGRAQKKKDAATIGGSVAGGAVLGRVLSKNDKTRGTLIGAVLGAAIGGAVAAENRGDPVLLEAGSRALLQLDQPLEILIAD